LEPKYEDKNYRGTIIGYRANPPELYVNIIPRYYCVDKMHCFMFIASNKNG
jgi:hypothetical protein